MNNLFQILDKEGNAITIAQLDKEAAEFWNKELNGKYYANPTPSFTNSENLEGRELFSAKMKHSMNESSNWLDVIGRAIANQGIYGESWENVVRALLAEHMGEAFFRSNDRQVDLAYIHMVEEGEFVTFNPHQDLLLVLCARLEFYRPYVNLINHWAEKGYTPKQIKG